MKVFIDLVDYSRGIIQVDMNSPLISKHKPPQILRCTPVVHFADEATLTLVG